MKNIAVEKKPRHSQRKKSTTLKWKTGVAISRQDKGTVYSDILT